MVIQVFALRLTIILTLLLANQVVAMTPVQVQKFAPIELEGQLVVGYAAFEGCELCDSQAGSTQKISSGKELLEVIYSSFQSEELKFSESEELLFESDLPRLKRMFRNALIFIGFEEKKHQLFVVPRNHVKSALVEYKNLLQGEKVDLGARVTKEAPKSPKKVADSLNQLKISFAGYWYVEGYGEPQPGVIKFHANPQTFYMDVQDAMSGSWALNEDHSRLTMMSMGESWEFPLPKTINQDTILESMESSRNPAQSLAIRKVPASVAAQLFFKQFGDFYLHIKNETESFYRLIRLYEDYSFHSDWQTKGSGREWTFDGEKLHLNFGRLKLEMYFKLNEEKRLVLFASDGEREYWVDWYKEKTGF